MSSEFEGFKVGRAVVHRWNASGKHCQKIPAIFISLYRIAAESFAGEQASRLIAI
jgi:hypothetical protein